MTLLLLTLLACTAEPDEDTSPPPPTACECEDPIALPFTVSESGGFDDWGGAAVAWAVDEAAGRALVIAVRYPTGISQIPMEVTCDDPDALVGSWVAGVPPSAADAASRYPLLAGALTTAAGVRSLSEEVGALLLEGSLASATPDRILVSTGGNLTLLRRDGGDTLQGAVEFGAEADVVGGSAVDACDRAVRIGALDLDVGSSGSE
ncbi:MAG: hypothetical protein Q8P18_20000 [Pseudomonadota bacterium]|nr:hypothetical protein [Pseudomonadota bacterium]